MHKSNTEKNAVDKKELLNKSMSELCDHFNKLDKELSKSITELQKQVEMLGKNGGNSNAKHIRQQITDLTTKRNNSLSLFYELKFEKIAEDITNKVDRKRNRDKNLMFYKEIDVRNYFSHKLHLLHVKHIRNLKILEEAMEKELKLKLSSLDPKVKEMLNKAQKAAEPDSLFELISDGNANDAKNTGDNQTAKDSSKKENIETSMKLYHSAEKMKADIDNNIINSVKETYTVKLNKEFDQQRVNIMELNKEMNRRLQDLEKEKENLKTRLEGSSVASTLKASYMELMKEVRQRQLRPDVSDSIVKSLTNKYQSTCAKLPK